MTRVAHRAVAAALLSICMTVLGLVFTPCARAQPTSTDREVSLAELLAFAAEHAAATRIALLRRGYGRAAMAGAAPLLRDDATIELDIGPRFDGAGERDFDFTASVEQPVEIAGEHGLRVDAASRLAARLDAEDAATRWEVRREVTLAYHAAVIARARIALNETLARFEEELLTTARRRLAAGDATAVDVLLAETALAQSRQALLSTRQALRAARLRLAEVSGWAIDEPPSVPASLDAPRPVPTLAALLLLGARQHPELVARRAAVRDAHAQAALAAREVWPAPVFGVQVAREGSTREPASYVVLGTLRMTLPLWQRGAGERARAHVDEDLARCEESAATRELRSRIARAYSELRSASERIAWSTSNVTAPLEASLALLQRAFEAGELPLFAISYARAQLLEAQRASLDAYADYYRALAELEFAVGAELPAANAAPTTGGAR